MGSRALRKKQRELEEKAQGVSLDNEAEELEYNNPTQRGQHREIFSLLQSDEGNDSEESVEKSETQINSENELSLPTDSNTTQISQSASKSKNAKKKKKKAKGSHSAPKASSSKRVSSQGSDDELDQILQSLSTKETSIANTITDSNPSARQIQELLSVDSKHLHTSNEIRKLFGSSAVDDERVDDDTPQPRRRGRGAQNVGSQTLSSLRLKRNCFVQEKDAWPKATSGGLGMEVVSNGPDETVEFRFVHSRGYQDVQLQFFMCVESMDPERLIQLLHFNPYHISTILQVSEIFKQQGDHSVSGELIERALFSFGRSLHSKFQGKLAQGRARMDFRRPENREFWLASWRYINNLGMRGLWRTALEWGKLLLALDPKQDRYRVALIMDQLALRARQPQTLVDLIESRFFLRRWDSYANILFSHGLAYYQLKDEAKSKKVLRVAIQRFPWVAARLLQELNVDKVPRQIWGKLPPTPVEEFFTVLYMSRAKGIWNTPEATALLLEAVSSIDSEGSSDRGYAIIFLDVIRHAALTDDAEIIRALPISLPSRSLMPTDPIPPYDNKPDYSLGPQMQSGEPGSSKVELMCQRHLYEEYCHAIGGEGLIHDEVALKDACISLEELDDIRERIKELEESVNQDENKETN